MSSDFLEVQAPGRINIIGEHIDYNSGYVLPAAIDKVTTFRLRSNASDVANFTATNVNQTFQFDLRDFAPVDGDWQNYVMGVVHELQKLGAKIPGFDAEFNGNVPIGSGLSSSAALECSLAVGLNELFDLGFDQWQLIKACQKAEHNFVGIKCGIMDQFASVMGQDDRAMLLDCETLSFEYVPLSLENYEFILINTQVTHSLASSKYNKRRESCENGLGIIKKFYPEVQTFRQVTQVHLDNLQTELGPIFYNRCHHVVAETNRVLRAVEALRNGNLQKLGALMFDSHYSLSKQYEVSCPELDFLVDQCQENQLTLGSRMMGGGFGGCTLNLVKSDLVEHTVEVLSEQYERQFKKFPEVYKVNVGSGAKVI